MSALDWFQTLGAAAGFIALAWLAANAIRVSASNRRHHADALRTIAAAQERSILRPARRSSMLEMLDNLDRIRASRAGDQ